MRVREQKKIQFLTCNNAFCFISKTILYVNNYMSTQKVVIITAVHCCVCRVEREGLGELHHSGSAPSY